MDPIECSFCGRPRAQVARLVNGPGIMICDQCVERAKGLDEPVHEDLCAFCAKRLPVHRLGVRGGCAPCVQLCVEILAEASPAPRKSTAVPWTSAVLGLLVAVAAVGYLARGDSVEVIAMSLLFWLVATQLQLVAHEVGHFLVAWWLGWPLQSIAFGLVLLEHAPTGWRVRINPGSSFSGRTVVRIRSAHGLRGRFALYVLGGPVVTLLVGASSVAVAVWVEDWRVAWLASLNAFISVLIAGENLLPRQRVEATGPASDGYQLLGLWKREPSVLGPVFLEAVVEAARAGKRVSESGLSFEDLAMAARPPPEKLGWPHLLASVHALERGRPELARPWLERAAREPTETQPEVTGDLLVHATAMQALLDGAPASARMLLDQLRLRSHDGDSIALVEAAVLAAEGNITGARAALARWRAYVSATADPVARAAGTEWIVEALEARLAPGDTVRESAVAASA